jgi:glycerophosphoryl diester phosphodiesterase
MHTRRIGDIAGTAALALSAVAASTMLALRAARLPQGPPRAHWQQAVFGHRGCRFVADIPENTIPAFAYAAQRGATGIEIDVRLCGSGELVVFHDAYLAPIFDVASEADGRRLVENTTLTELKAMRYAADPTKSTQISTLTDVVAFCDAKRLALLVEVKHIGWHREAECVRRVVEGYREHAAFLEDCSIVISFNPILLYKLRRAEPRAAVGILHHDTFASDLAYAPDDHYALWYCRIFPALQDRVAELIMARVAPWLIGASMVGTARRQFTKGMHERHRRTDRLLYLWGTVDPTSVADLEGVCVACDDDHDVHIRTNSFALSDSVGTPTATTPLMQPLQLSTA